MAWRVKVPSARPVGLVFTRTLTHGGNGKLYFAREDRDGAGRWLRWADNRRGKVAICRRHWWQCGRSAQSGMSVYLSPLETVVIGGFGRSSPVDTRQFEKA